MLRSTLSQLFILLFFQTSLFAQIATPPLSLPSGTNLSTSADVPLDLGDERPNGKRIRRQLNLIVGVAHDEEFLIPDKETVYKGRTEFFDMSRIKGTDFFRITPKKAGSGIMTMHDKKTGQILVEIRFDIRDDAIEKTMREVQLLLADIEGIEYKIINGLIVLDGFVLLPRDLVRIAQVIRTWGPERVKSLVGLSPIARKRIADFITNDINNPEVKVTAVGEYIKLEGQVNSTDEKRRINQIVALYLPDVVVELAPDTENFQVKGRKNAGRLEDIIIDLITVKRDDERVEPPPKMIQVVAHFVKFNDGFIKSFNFSFSPIISAQSGTSTTPSTTLGETATLISNLLPKLNWAKFHGFAKVLDTASILIQDKKPGTISRTVTSNTTFPGQNGAVQIVPVTATVTLNVTPTIKSERSGLVELPLNVTVTSPGKTDSTNTQVTTTISVRDRQSAAFGGIIKKDTDTSYGSPVKPDAIITLEASKAYTRNNSQFVVFVTPIIKSSASAGVEQVKKKFRLKD